MSLQRYSVTLSVAMTDSLATTGRFQYSNFAGGVIILPAGISSLTWYVSSTEDGTYVQINDKANAGAVNPASVTQSLAYPLPDELFGAPWVKIVANTAGTATVCLKS